MWNKWDAIYAIVWSCGDSSFSNPKFPRDFMAVHGGRRHVIHLLRHWSWPRNRQIRRYVLITVPSPNCMLIFFSYFVYNEFNIYLTF